MYGAASVKVYGFTESIYKKPITAVSKILNILHLQNDRLTNKTLLTKHIISYAGSFLVFTVLIFLLENILNLLGLEHWLEYRSPQISSIPIITV